MKGETVAGQAMDSLHQTTMARGWRRGRDGRRRHVLVPKAAIACPLPEIFSNVVRRARGSLSLRDSVALRGLCRSDGAHFCYRLIDASRAKVVIPLS